MIRPEAHLASRSASASGSASGCFVCEDTRILHHLLPPLYLMIIAPVLLILQRLLRRHSVVDHLLVLLVLPALGRTDPLVIAPNEKCLSLVGSTDIIVLLPTNPRVVLHVLLVMLLRLLFGDLGLKIIVVARHFLRQRLAEHDRHISFYLLRVIQLHSKIIKLFVLVELILAQHKYFSIFPHILILMLVSLSSLNDRQSLLFFRSIFLPFATQHPILNFLIFSNFLLFLPFVIGTHKMKSIIDQIFLDIDIKRCISGETRSVVDFK